MKFIPGSAGVWHLIDENATADANRIATMNGPVEILAVKALCEEMLKGKIAPTAFRREGVEYRVTPYRDRGDRLSVRIDGSDASLGRVETEFRWPGT